MEPTGEQEVFRFQSCELDPRLHCISGSWRDLKLNGSLRLVLDDDRARRYLLKGARTSSLNVNFGEDGRTDGLGHNRFFPERSKIQSGRADG